MAPKKNLLKRAREDMKMIAELISYTKSMSERMYELGITEDGEYLKELAEECQSIVVSATKALENFHKNFRTEEELKSLKTTVEKITKEAHDLRERVDDFEEKLLKYDIPYLDECESYEDYLKDLRMFMKAWKQEAEIGRVKGEKSLIEWLRQLDQSDHKERKTTFEGMKLTLIDLGTQISHHLIEFFLYWTVLVERENMVQKLNDVAVILGLLSVEENSIVIKRFLTVVEFVERTMKEFEQCSTDIAEIEAVDETEQEVIRLILREILRLEVALCCPDLPMKLIDRVYLSMGSHLRKVFENKLKKVSLKIDELKKMEVLEVRDEDRKTLSHLRGTLEVGMKEIWNKLDLQSY